MSAHIYEHAEYLGDAVYASFDGYQIWLTTGDGNDQRIALEPPVFAALVRYEARLRALHSTLDGNHLDELHKGAT